MDPRQLFVDQRLIGSCVYCGGEPNSRDHVPSKILLDDPLPLDLPVVGACSSCNNSFSLDEEYLACFLDCVLAGSTNCDLLSRDKIKQILVRKTVLATRIQLSCRRDKNGKLLWIPEYERVRNVVLKLARGHVTFELNHPLLEVPEAVNVLPLSLMSEADLSAFENSGSGGMRGWPELGSRAFYRSCGSKPYADQSGPWVVVQPGRYRYSVDEQGGVTVQIVISEYLACVVYWA